jgi:hypothetical protein
MTEIRWIPALLSLVLMSACSSTRMARDRAEAELPPERPAQELWEAIDAARLSYTTFSGRMDLEIEDQNGRSSAVAFVRMHRDSLIWLSFRKAGIEGARLLISRDSLHILDRNEKAYYPLSFAYMDSLFHLELGLEALQDFFAGAPLHRQPLAWVAGRAPGSYQLLGASGAAEYRYTIAAGSNHLSGMAWTETGRGRSVSVELRDHEPQGPAVFPMTRNLMLEGESPARLTARFTRVSTDEPGLSFAFSVSPSYQVIRELP